MIRFLRWIWQRAVVLRGRSVLPSATLLAGLLAIIVLGLEEGSQVPRGSDSQRFLALVRTPPSVADGPRHGDGRKIHSVAEYFLETGYIWPLLGFVLACVLLWRTRQRSASFEQAPSCELPAQARQVRSAKVPAGYSVVPVGQTTVTSLAFDLMDRNHDGVITRQEFSQALEPQYLSAPPAQPVQPASPAKPISVAAVATSMMELKPEWSRNDFSSPALERPVFFPGIGTRVGAMTAQKVIEIERLLIQDLEDSLLQKVGFLANLFQSWRAEVLLQRYGREIEEDMGRQRGDWERFMAEQQKTHEARLQACEDAATQRRFRWRHTLSLMMEQWSRGEGAGLAHGALRAWRDWSSWQHVLGVQRKRVQAAVLAWVEGDCRGCVHASLKSWRQLADLSKEVKKREAELASARRSWQQFADEEVTRSKAEQEAASQALSQAKARARQDVTLVLQKWDRGASAGLLGAVLLAWDNFASRTRSLHRQKRCVHQVLLQFVEGAMAGAVRGCFGAWRNDAEHVRTVEGERRQWEDLLNGERARLADELQTKTDEGARHRKASDRLVRLTLRKWELGDTTGLLTEVLGSWHLHAARRRLVARSRAGVHASVLKWAEGDQVGLQRSCLLRWRLLGQHATQQKAHEADLRKQRDSLESLLSDERRRFEDAEGERLSEAERLKDQARGVVEFSLLRWQLGSKAGLAAEVLRAWAAQGQAARRHSRQRQSVHVALMKALEGDETAVAHACFMNWRLHAQRAAQVQHGEARLAEERRRWDTYLADQRKLHDEALGAANSEAEQRCKSAHRATELMLQQWQRGDTAGLLAAAVSCWRQLNIESVALRWRRQSVHAAVLRFCEGDQRAAVHLCLLNWRQWAKVEAVFKEEVYERDRRITQLEARTRSLLGKEKSRLLKFARMMGDSEDAVFLVMLLAAWRMESCGVRAVEAQRQLEVALEECQRLHDLALTRRRRMALASLECLGVKHKQMWALECFLTWSFQWQQTKQDWAFKLAHNKAVSKYSWYIQCQFFKQDTSAILAACFWELLREARSRKHAREREEAHLRIEESTMLLLRIQEERNDLEEQLKMAFRQIDTITETLQKELKTKEELAAELRDVYDKLRKSTTRRVTEVSESLLQLTMARTGGANSSRPSSAARSETLPHLPVALMGAPGGPVFSLTGPLVKGSDEW